MNNGNALPECPRRDANKENCPCKSVDCVRRGICCECVAYHREKGSKCACMR